MSHEFSISLLSVLTGNWIFTLSPLAKQLTVDFRSCNIVLSVFNVVIVGNNL